MSTVKYFVNVKRCLATTLAATLALVFCIGFYAAPVKAEPAELYEADMYVDYVNPYIGTAYDSSFHSGSSEYGGMIPWVSTPFGMTKWTPQTRQNQINTMSYNYADSYITGFMATHQPAIWMGDFGYFNMMPGVDSVKTSTTTRRLSFSHDDETTTPYYYSVTMDAGSGRDITGEMTATSRSSIVRFTYPQNNMSNVYLEMTRSGVEGKVEIDAARGEISGYNTHRMDAHLSSLALNNFKGYYVIQFSKPFATYGVTTGNTQSQNVTRVVGNNVGAFVTFATDEGEVVEIRVGSSFISIDQARENLKKEIPSSMTFDDVKDNLKDLWEEKLSKIEIEGASNDDMAIFYTAMYHALLFPIEFSEYGRYYSAYDDSIHWGDAYTSYSIWDTFRAENSFITLIAPERVDGMIRSLLNVYKEGGYMPKWPNPSYTSIMISTHADSLVAEAIAKGFKGFDYDLAYEACFKDGMVPPIDDTSNSFGDRHTGHIYEARAGLTYLLEKGYIPTDWTTEAASRTLEGAYDDWCIAQVAKAVGKTDDYEYFINRAQYYKNIYNTSTGLIQARNNAGNFVSGGWTEGSQMNYAYCVLQDFGGLMNLMSESRYNSVLDNYFSSGQNYHPNEPSHHYGYLYDYSGEPWKTQKQVRSIAKANYENHPARGLRGNEDCGQMSAWYIFSALGFYPVNPASAEYMIGSPFFTKATIHYDENDFVIKANNNSDQNVYVQSASLNGAPLDIPVITHEQIVSGGELVFEMGDAASTWGSSYRPAPLPNYGSATTPTVPDWMKHPESSDVASDNLALTAVCTSTSSVTGIDIGGEPNKVNDGKLNTGLMSQNNPTLPQYVTLTWDEPQSFNAMTLYSNYNKQQAPYNWDIEVSDNGIDGWRLIMNTGDIAWNTSVEATEGIEVPFTRVTDVKGFRIKINKAYLDWNHYAIREIEIFDRIDTANVALSAICSSTSSVTGIDIGGEPDKVNDGRLNTGLMSQNNPSMPQYVTLTWSTPRTFNMMTLYSNYNRSQAPYNWDIEVSDNGIDGWRFIMNTGDIDWKTSVEATEGIEIMFDRVDNVKGFRIKINKAYLTWNHYAIREIELFNITGNNTDILAVSSVEFFKDTVEKGNEIIALSSGKIVGTVDVSSVKNPREIAVILALYTAEGRLNQYKIEEYTLTSEGRLDVVLDIPEKDLTGYFAKLMVWDGVTFAPLTNATLLI